MLLLGFSSGLPILLVFSTLSIWLIKAGVNRSTVTMFSWVGLAYSFKFIWTPIIDNLRLPIKNFGHRKSWLFFSQTIVIFGLIFISFTDPSKTLLYTAAGAVIIAFASATQDVIIDAYRIESAPQKFQGILSSMYIAGYRIAMLVAGAGSLLLAAYFGVEVYNVNVWRSVYLSMASLMTIGILTTIFLPEPKIIRNNSLISLKDQFRFLISFIIFIFIFIFFYREEQNKQRQRETGEWNPVALLVFRWQGDTPKRDVVPEPPQNFQLLECERLLEKIQRLAFRDRGTPTLLTGQKRGQPEGHETTLLFVMEGVRDLLLV